MFPAYARRDPSWQHSGLARTYWQHRRAKTPDAVIASGPEGVPLVLEFGGADKHR
jgi:hypothetical protein